MKTRKAELADLKRMLEIEESAIPGYGYLLENKDFYFDGIQNQGEMILALKEDLPVGMGQYSILPDGSGWLEILRVHKDFQHQGAGQAIYNRYQELALQTNAPSMAMFTGRRNIASKSLAEKNGFELAAALLEYNLNVEHCSLQRSDHFELVTDAALAEELIQKNQVSWGKFMALNRTFFHYGSRLYQWLCEKRMVYSDGQSVLVLGCRMLRHRGLMIGYMDGDLKKCIRFAAAHTMNQKLPKLSISFPNEREDLIQLCTEMGFESAGELIVMEKQLRKENLHV